MRAFFFIWVTSLMSLAGCLPGQAQSRVSQKKSQPGALNNEDYGKHQAWLDRINEAYNASSFQVKEGLFEYLKKAARGIQVSSLKPPDPQNPICDCHVGAYLRKASSWPDFCARTKYLLDLAQYKTNSGRLDQRVEGLYIYMSLSYPMIHYNALDRDKKYQRLHETLSFIIGKLWLHSLLETGECKKMPDWAFVTLFKACWEHARLGEIQGKKHYLYTARFYETILNKRIVYRKPFTTKAYYNASWMYLQVDRIADSRRMARLMPTYPGMHTAPKQLLKWNRQRFEQMSRAKNKH